MIDSRFHYDLNVTATEDRVQGLLRERSMQKARRRPDPRPEGRRRWSGADFLALLGLARDARPSRGTLPPVPSR